MGFPSLITTPFSTLAQLQAAEIADKYAQKYVDTLDRGEWVHPKLVKKSLKGQEATERLRKQSQKAIDANRWVERRVAERKAQHAARVVIDCNKELESLENKLTLTNPEARAKASRTTRRLQVHYLESLCQALDDVLKGEKWAPASLKEEKEEEKEEKEGKNQV